MNGRGEYAFDEALDKLSEAEARMSMVAVMTADILTGMHRGEDVRPELDALLDVMLAARRSMSQAAGWVDKAMLEIDRERRDDDTGAR